MTAKHFLTPLLLLTSVTLIVGTIASTLLSTTEANDRDNSPKVNASTHSQIVHRAIIEQLSVYSDSTLNYLPTTLTQQILVGSGSDDSTLLDVRYSGEITATNGLRYTAVVDLLVIDGEAIPVATNLTQIEVTP